MALGYTYSSAIPRMLQNNADALVQNIRQIGQTVSGHLTELQTRRDLQTMGQEIQGLNPQTDDFPIQLSQLAFRHPLALRDERGQMALEVLGKSHQNWQQSKILGQRLTGQNVQIGLRGEESRKTEGAKQENRIEIEGIRDTSRQNIESTRQKNRKELEQMEREGKVTFRNIGNKMYAIQSNGAGGQTATQIAENQVPEDALKRIRVDIALRKEKRDTLKSELGTIEGDIQAARRQHAALQKQLPEATDENRSKLETEFRIVSELLQDLGKKRAEKENQINQVKAEDDEAVAPDSQQGPYPTGQGDGLPPVPANALTPQVAPPEVMPSPGQVAAPVPGANVRRVPMINPQGQRMGLREDQVPSALQAGWKRL